MEGSSGVHTHAYTHSLIIASNVKTTAGWRVPVAFRIKGKLSALKKNRFLKWPLSSKLVFFTVVSIISARLICHLSNCRLNLICKGSYTLVVVCSTAIFFQKAPQKKFQGRKRNFPSCHFCCRRYIFFLLPLRKIPGCLKQWFNLHLPWKCILHFTVLFQTFHIKKQ